MKRIFVAILAVNIVIGALLVSKAAPGAAPLCNRPPRNQKI